MWHAQVAGKFLVRQEDLDITDIMTQLKHGWHVRQGRQYPQLYISYLDMTLHISKQKIDMNNDLGPDWS